MPPQGPVAGWNPVRPGADSGGRTSAGQLGRLVAPPRQTPVIAGSRAMWMACTMPAWSASVWSAYAMDHVVMASSNLLLLPR